MDITIKTLIGGTIELTCEGESILVSQQNTLSNNGCVITFPIPIVIEADEPPLTGMIGT